MSTTSAVCPLPSSFRTVFSVPLRTTADRRKQKSPDISYQGIRELVGAEGFEPSAFCSRSKRATRLRYAPTGLKTRCSISHFPGENQVGVARRSRTRERKRRWRKNGGTVASWQRTSEIGKASQIASVRFSMKCGRIQIHGMRITPCRSVESTTAVHGCPIPTLPLP